MASLANNLDDLWSKGFVSLHQVPGILKSERPLLSMSFPTIRQAVRDQALKVLEIGNQMRVSREALDTFIKVVEEGLYCPASNPLKARWVNSTTTEQQDVTTN